MKTLDEIKKIIAGSKKAKIYFSMLAVCVIILISINIMDIGDNKKESEEVSSNSEQAESSISSNREYINTLEEKLEYMINSIEGVSNVNVMITTKGTEKYEYAQEEADVISDDKTEKEKKYVLGEDDKPITVTVNNPEITGAVVICDGSESSLIKEKIYKTVSVSLGIEINKIYVSN